MLLLGAPKICGGKATARSNALAEVEAEGAMVAAVGTEHELQASLLA